MKFVWIMREVPFEPDSGMLIYSNGLLRGLLESGATGTLVAYRRPEADRISIPRLSVRAVEPKNKIRALSLFSRDHSDSYRLRSRAFAGEVARAMETGPDFVVVDYFASGWVLPIVRASNAATGKKTTLVYVSHNFESSLRLDVANSAKSPWMRAVLRLDAAKAGAMERALVAGSDLIVVNTDEDGAKYREIAPDRATLTLTPAYDGEIVETEALTAERPRRVIVVGSFDWVAKQANLERFLDAAEQGFTKAGIEVLVVGRAPESFMAAMSARYRFCSFTGRVEDVKPYLSDGRIGVMPDEVGGGFKHKYLYYIFAGLPVATIRPQIAGLPIDPDRDFITRDTMSELVQAVIDNLDDLATLNAMRQRCWELCAPAFSWRDRGLRLAQQLQSLAIREGEASEVSCTPQA